MNVVQTESGWAVVQDGRTIREFPTHAAAWRWVDRHERRELWARRETADWTGEGVYFVCDGELALTSKPMHRLKTRRKKQEKAGRAFFKARKKASKARRAT